MERHEHDVASPAAAVLDRRRSRTTPDKRKQSYVESEGSESGSDGEWSGDGDPLSDHGREDEDEEEDEAVRVVACGRTRSCRARTAWSLTMGDTSRWQRRDGLAGLWWCAVWAPVEEQTWRSCLGARGEYGAEKVFAQSCGTSKVVLKSV